MGLRSRWQTKFDQWADTQEAETDAVAPYGYKRAPLTTNQHILHLLLTVVTAGLWGIVWFIRAWQGNRVPRQGAPPAGR
jgi:hypothetical protein